MINILFESQAANSQKPESCSMKSAPQALKPCGILFIFPKDYKSFGCEDAIGLSLLRTALKPANFSKVERKSLKGFL